MITQTAHRQSDLSCWFDMQDECLAANRQEMAAQYAWLDTAVKLLTDVQVFVNSHESVAECRSDDQANTPERFLAQTIVVNLLNDALGGIVSATRLLLFGAHADSYALIRSAFEASAYSEYFAHNPDKVRAFMELEAIILANPKVNLNSEYAQRGLRIGSILKELNGLDGQDRSGFYATLCNWGAHPSPLRVGLRLSAPKGAVLAAASRSTPEWSRRQWTINGATFLMHVAHYAAEIAFENFEEWFVLEPSWATRRDLLTKQFRELTESAQ